MKNNQLLKISSLFFLLILTIFLFSSVKASAKTKTIQEILNDATYEEYEIEPKITFLTPGANSKAGYFGWFDEIIEDTFVDQFMDLGYICHLLTNDSDINNYHFEESQKYVFVFNNSTVAYYGHDIYSYENGVDDYEHDASSYLKLEALIEKVIYKYMIDIYGKDLTNYKIPRINMVGHSRGGINNMIFATRHPLLVDKLFSIGTPYNGSKLYYDILEQGFDAMEVFDDLILSQCVDRNINTNLKEAWNNYRLNDAYPYHTKLYTLSGLTAYTSIKETIRNYIRAQDLSFVKKFFYVAIFDMFFNKQQIILNEDGTYSIFQRFNRIINLIESQYNHFRAYIGDNILGFNIDGVFGGLRYIASIFDHMEKLGDVYYTKSDFFVDDASQSAEGFIVDYNYKKVFQKNNSNFAHHVYDQTPAIVHALEPMDESFIEFVIEVIENGNYNNFHKTESDFIYSFK